MPFQVGGVVYAHGDGKVVIAARGKNIKRTIHTAKSVKGDNNVEAFLMGGTYHEPTAIGVGQAKPDFSIGVDALEEITDFAAAVGDGFAQQHYDVTVTFQQSPGSRTMKVEFENCIIEKGWGLSSEAGGGPGTELSGKCRSVILNGKRPFKVGTGSGGSLLGALGKALGSLFS